MQNWVPLLSLGRSRPCDVQLLPWPRLFKAMFPDGWLGAGVGLHLTAHHAYLHRSCASKLHGSQSRRALTLPVRFQCSVLILPPDRFGKRNSIAVSCHSFIIAIPSPRPLASIIFISLFCLVALGGFHRAEFNNTPPIYFSRPPFLSLFLGDPIRICDHSGATAAKLATITCISTPSATFS